MPMTTAEAQAQIVDQLDAAVERISLAVDLLGEAYEHVNVDTQDRLEDELFRPAQRALGRAKRARNEFAAQSGLAAGTVAPPPHRITSTNARETISHALEACGEAGHILAELQDSLLPAEFGDASLRAGIAEARSLIDSLPPRMRDLFRSLGR